MTRTKPKPTTEHVALWTERGTTYIKLPLIAFGAMTALLVLLAILFFSVKRLPQPRLRVEKPGALQELLPSLAGLTHGTLAEGNRVEVLQNGDGYFGALFRDIGNARETVHIESYIWWEGNTANRFAELLIRKAKQGVEVRLLVDAIGGKDLGGELEERMSAAGVKVGKFHPIRLTTLGRLNNRDHRKVIVIDDRIGLVAGHGIADEWTGNAQDRDHWRDTALRVEGPIVSSLQSAFSENWIEATREVPAGEKYFPKQERAGSSVAHVAYTSPEGEVSSVEILHHLAISAARSEILIQNPYLLPDRESLELLERAVARGVRVRIMVPSADATDSPLVQHASHHRFGALLEHGVEIYEYDKTLLHQKLLVIDRLWSCVGSTNFDERSFELNDELSLAVVDEQIAAELARAFENDLRFAKRRQKKEWQDRGLVHKLRDALAYLGRSQL